MQTVARWVVQRAELLGAMTVVKLVVLLVVAKAVWKAVRKVQWTAARWVD